MRRLWVGGSVVAVALIALSMGTAADDKKDTKKVAPVIEIKVGKDDKFRFFVRDDEGKMLAMSGPTGFDSEKEARGAVVSLKAVIAKAKVVVVPKETPKDAPKDK